MTEYRLSEEHEAIRDAVRALCEGKVAPNAAAADETGEFPQASYDALRAGDFHAPHIPVEYGGAGARSEEHKSELQSRSDIVCRLLLAKKNGTRSAGQYQRRASPAPPTRLANERP